ncbi:MAG: topoisomerase DNA-binding C4 zinc finger domain-containing protein [Lachnospiraceae bacterium]|nr:topoisomerase DNA-binding C4 zinc finger domain-containing protein [Lachnospiraceae bacterium]
MLSDKHGSKLDTYVSDYVVFDLETTGVSPYVDKIVEISAVKVIGGKTVDEFSTLVNPECHISQGASAVNGIYDEMVADAPTFEEVLPQFLEFIGDMVLVGHNIHAFDMNFIYRDSEAYSGKFPDNDYVDTLTLARRCLPQLARHRMTDLAAHYGISTEGAHRALADCYMTQKVYEFLRGELAHIHDREKNIRLCRRCGREMKLRNGRYGEFWGCLGYPKCNYTENSESFLR